MRPTRCPLIDPVIFSFKLFGGLTLTLRWYGVLVMLGAVVGSWIAEKEIRRRGENGALVWDALVWVLPPGIIGARLWYVLNVTLGGSSYYLDDPWKIINIPEGGLHFFGGLLFGAIALYYYVRRYKLDGWLLLDAIAPAALIGQAVARPANFINQELYGPPTTLPWGISIDAFHRIPIYQDLVKYPVETTRFHPTFAYEMIWNFLAAALLLWLARRFADRLKPGAIFGGWLVLAGVGRVLIEFFRPDQPKIPGTAISYSALVSALMAVAGVILLLSRFGKLRLGSFQWPETYRLAAQPFTPVMSAPVKKSAHEAEAPAKKPAPRARRVSKLAKTKPKTKKAE
jgi:phosphatidylglycerol---prolipoprotein diacylglyceryl transferase